MSFEIAAGETAPAVVHIANVENHLGPGGFGGGVDGIGVGHGEKAQVQTMVKVLLPRAQFDTHDAADALAIAICHAHHRQTPPR